MNWQSFALYGGREPERVRVADVSSELFSILGIGPTFGRNFGGDESILGRTITDAEKTFTVVGIMPADLKRRCHSAWLRIATGSLPSSYSSGAKA